MCSASRNVVPGAGSMASAFWIEAEKPPAPPASSAAFFRKSRRESIIDRVSWKLSQVDSSLRRRSEIESYFSVNIADGYAAQHIGIIYDRVRCFRKCQTVYRSAYWYPMKFLKIW